MSDSFGMNNVLFEVKILLTDKFGDERHDAPRTEVFDYTTHHYNENAAHEAYHLFNAPESLIDAKRLPLVAEYRAKRLRSLSVGDVVVVGNTHYYCDSFGWTDITPDSAMSA